MTLAIVAAFSEAMIESLAKLLGDCGTGSDISRVFGACGITDRSGESTKWKRLYYTFLELQQTDRSANRVLGFVEAFIAPARFVGRLDEFERDRAAVNGILVLSGVEYGRDGRFRPTTAAKTLDEAEERANTIRAKFKGRAIHGEVLKYCRKELLQDNYFHAVFEASKGLAQRIRDMSGQTLDGAALVDLVFSVERPILAFNSLRTETDRSEHKGFAQLLKGCFGAIRNPAAHLPRIMWHGEDDAADYLSLISLLHRKLDDCVRVPGAGS